MFSVPIHLRLLRGLMTESKNVQILHHELERETRKDQGIGCHKPYTSLSFVSAITSNSKHNMHRTWLSISQFDFCLKSAIGKVNHSGKEQISLGFL